MQVLTVLSTMGAGSRAIPILRAINNFEISNIAEYIGQISHETQDFKIFEENLNYSVDGLLATFSRLRISEAEAKRIGRTATRKANKVAIAEALYGHTTAKGKELGNIYGGDGWMFRGSGDIQITGRANFLAASLAIFGDERLVNNADLVRQDPEISSAVGGWYWKSRRLNELGDNVLKISKAVNLGSPQSRGNPKGLADREAKTKRARDLLSSPEIYGRG